MSKALLALVLLFSLLSYSQKISVSKIDILLREVTRSKEGVKKVVLLQMICEEYYDKDEKNLFFYNLQLLDLSRRIKFNEGYGYYYYNQLVLLGNDHKKKTAVAEKAAAIFLKFRNYKYYLNARFELADASFEEHHYKAAEAIILKTLERKLEKAFPYEVGNLHTLLGTLYYNDGRLGNALESFNNAKYLFNKVTVANNDLLDLYLNIAFTETDLGHYQASLQYLNLVDANRKNVAVNMEKAFVYNRIKSYKKALELLIYNKSTLEMSKLEEVYNDLLLAETHFLLTDYEMSVQILMPTLKSSSNKKIKLETYNLLTKSYLKLGDLKNARKYNDQAGDYVTKSKIPTAQQDYFLSKSEIEEGMGNLRAAIKNRKIYEELIKDYNTKLNEEKINELQLRFNFAEKVGKIKSLEVDELKKNIVIKKQQNYIRLGLFFFVVVLVGAMLFFRLYKIIKQKNVVIESKNTKLSATQSSLRKSLIEKETLLREVHHRVKNNLQLIMSMLNIQARRNNYSDIFEFLKKGETRIFSMALIHQSLCESEDSLEKIDFEHYLRDLVQSIKQTFDISDDVVDVTIKATDIVLNLPTAIPVGLIVNELVTNSFKHAFPDQRKGVLTITIEKKEANIFILSVEDDGIGISKSKKRAKSFGMDLISLLAVQLKGSFKFESEVATKSIIQFSEIVM